VKKSLFGTSGIRGHAEKVFTPQFCFDIGRSFGQFLDRHEQDGGVVIGMDPRGSSPRIKDNVSHGLIDGGREVYDEGASPVPAINHILKVSTYYAGSIMISGSHIKPHLNGIKFFAFGEEILKEHEVELEKIYEFLKNKQEYREGMEFEIHDENAANDEYVEYLIGKANLPYPMWKVVVDPGDGAQSDVMPAFLKRVGLEVVEMNSTIQGLFYSRDTEAKGDFADLQKRVKKEKANFGIGYDSDGDRAVFIDENGKYIPGDFTGTLIAKEFGSALIATPVNTSLVVDSIGKKVIRTKVGSPYVVAKMKEKNLKFGFEANGGGIFAEMKSRDGGRTTVEILNLLKKSKKKLSNLIAQLPKTYLLRDKIDYQWSQQNEIIDKAKEAFKGEKFDETDGLKIWLGKKSWILFRSSQNAPEFRVFVESTNEKKAKELMKKSLGIVKSIVNK